MQRTSFEKSLAFLAPSLKTNKQKKVVSPVRVPEHNEEDLLDIESLLKGDSPTSVSSREEIREDEVESEREDEVESEREDEVESEREDEVESEREDEVESEREDEVESEREDEVESEREDEVESEREDEVESEREDELEVRSVGDSTDFGDDSHDEEDVRSHEVDSQDEEDSRSYQDEEDIREEIEITTRKGIQTLTPKRFKIKVPKSPVVKKEINEITDKLTAYRYNIIKFIFNEENSLIDYVICFDPNGEIVFIELDKEKVKVFDEEKIIKINYKDEGNTMSSSFIEGVRNKITYDVYGVVFFDGIDYVIMKRDSEGTIVSDTYTTVDTTLDKKANIPFVYSIIKLSHLLKSPLETIKRTKLTYQVIQNQQINTNKSTIRNLMETTKELTDKIYHFDRVYKRVTKDIVADWKTLSNYSSDYYGKFHDDELTEEDKESFDQVTVNMFVRFQIFNEQVENVNNLYKAIDRINHSIFTINETIIKLEEKNDKIKNRIIEIEEMEEYI